MAYSDFTLSKFKKSFSIRIGEETDLWARWIRSMCGRNVGSTIV